MRRKLQPIDRVLAARLGAEDAAAAVRRACASLLDETRTERAPIRLAGLARYLGAELRYDSSQRFGAEEASLHLKDGRIVLWVSKDRFEDPRTRARARFSIAHEIGHLILYKLLGPEFLEHSEAGEEAYGQTERLCDLAASQILMPRSLLAEGLRERGFGLEGVRALLKAFDVSASAMLKAIADLAPDGGVIELRKYRRKAAERVTWRVWACYTASASADLGSWLPSGCTLKHIYGLGDIDTLAPNIPQARPKIALLRGRTRVERDAVVCLWPARAPWGQESLIAPASGVPVAKRFSADDSGRVMVLVGRRERLDFTQFGAEPPP